jgi:hypothetical protein
MNGVFFGRGRHYFFIEAVPRGQVGPERDRREGDFAMTRSALRRTAVSFLFLLLSLTALASAAPVRPTARPMAGIAKSQSVFSFFWNWMINLWEKEGSSLDPSGKPLATSPRPNEGGSLDPDGFLPDAGSSLDPNGAQ